LRRRRRLRRVREKASSEKGCPAPFAARVPVVDCAPVTRSAARQPPVSPIRRCPDRLPFSPIAAGIPPAPCPNPCSLDASPVPCPRALRARSPGGGRTDSQDRMDLIQHAVRMINEALRSGRPVLRNTTRSLRLPDPGWSPASGWSCRSPGRHLGPRLPVLVRLFVPPNARHLFARCPSFPARAPCGRALLLAGRTDSHDRTSPLNNPSTLTRRYLARMRLRTLATTAAQGCARSEKRCHRRDDVRDLFRCEAPCR
jgi:hypothetical protein